MILHKPNFTFRGTGILPVSFGRAFTLVEILVVIGIIALLAGILLVTLGRVNRTASGIRSASDLQAISSALEAYFADFQFYPPVNFLSPALSPSSTQRPAQVNGSIVLTLALIGPANRTENPPAPSGSLEYKDGHDGPGFRVPSLSGANNLSSRTYGPYLQPERFRVKPVLANATLFPVLVDNNDIPILYVPASRSALGDVTQPGSYIDTRKQNSSDPSPLYALEPAVLEDGLRPFFRRTGETTDEATLARIRRMAGERKDTPNGSLVLTSITPGTQPDQNLIATGKQTFILWTAGPDAKFFPDAWEIPATSQAANRAAFLRAYNSCDDITNFRGAGQ